MQATVAEPLNPAGESAILSPAACSTNVASNDASPTAPAVAAIQGSGKVEDPAFEVVADGYGCSLTYDPGHGVLVAQGEAIDDGSRVCGV